MDICLLASPANHWQALTEIQNLCHASALQLIMSKSKEALASAASNVFSDLIDSSRGHIDAQCQSPPGGDLQS